MKHAFAPHLAGRMLPGIFSQFIGKTERFPGDPWPYMHVLPGWFWMHSTACTQDEQGCRYGLYIGRGITHALLEHESAAFNPPRRPAPPLPIAPARRTQTPSKPVVGDDRASVGSKRAREPADAGPQCELFGALP